MYITTVSPEEYFKSQLNISKRQHDAIRDLVTGQDTAAVVAKRHGYSVNSLNAYYQQFKKMIQEYDPENDFFFRHKKAGRKPDSDIHSLEDDISALRKKNFSAPEIKAIMDARNLDISERTITKILRQQGFEKLPRRSKEEKTTQSLPKILAAKAKVLSYKPEKFNSESLGVLCFLPLIETLGIDRLIVQSEYPESGSLSKLSSVLAFLAIKLNNVRRYSADDLWCMDRGLGLFAGMNVLPKASWFSSYSDRVSPAANLAFLKALHRLWSEQGLLGDTVNLDFTTIPYWGESSHLEKNWSGKRNQALASMLAVLAQDQDSGIIDYGSADVRQSRASDTILEFFDFYHADLPRNELKYLVFDSKFTTYQNLNRLDEQKIKFLTIRRRGKLIVDELSQIPKEKWKPVTVECYGHKQRKVIVFEQIIPLKGYGEGKGENAKLIRHIAIAGNKKIKPAIILTNDFALPLDAVLRKYARRWLVEKGISEQIYFFHLNNVSSSMVIKVDFDLVMTILAYNLYKILASRLTHYEKNTAQTLYEKFIKGGGEVKITEDTIEIYLKKRRNLPLILEMLQGSASIPSRILNHKNVAFYGATYS